MRGSTKEILSILHEIDVLVNFTAKKTIKSRGCDGKTGK